MTTIRVSDHDAKQIKQLQDLYDSDPVVRELINAWGDKNDQAKQLQQERDRLAGELEEAQKLHGKLIPVIYTRT